LHGRIVAPGVIVCKKRKPARRPERSDLTPSPSLEGRGIKGVRLIAQHAQGLAQVDHHHALAVGHGDGEEGEKNELQGHSGKPAIGRFADEFHEGIVAPGAGVCKQRKTGPKAGKE